MSEPRKCNYPNCQNPADLRAEVLLLETDIPVYDYRVCADHARQLESEGFTVLRASPEGDNRREP